MNTRIISGFPGVGKTVLFKQNKDLKILDSDSSQFSWIIDMDTNKPYRHPDFPQNYVNHIRKNIGKVDVILVSSHDVVRKALKENDIKYDLVYPSVDLKEDYIKRYKERGNAESFVKMISENWEKFISEIEKETFPNLIELDYSFQNLADLFIDSCKTCSHYTYNDDLDSHVCLIDVHTYGDPMDGLSTEPDKSCDKYDRSGYFR